MSKLLLAAISAFAMISLSGCATVTRGTHEAFVVESDPPGADVQLSSGLTCKTPCSLKVSRKDGFTVHINKAGYEPIESTVVAQTANSGAAGMAGNVLLGGLIGAAVDSGNGSMNELKPNPLSIKLTKMADVSVPINTAALPSPDGGVKSEPTSSETAHAKKSFAVASMSGAGAYAEEQIKGEPLHTFNDGEPLTVVEETADNRWFKILLPDGRTAYVASALVKVTSAPPKNEAIQTASNEVPAAKKTKKKKKQAPAPSDQASLETSQQSTAPVPAAAPEGATATAAAPSAP